jgi:hypothetical protein
MTTLPPRPSEEELRLESQLKELLDKVHTDKPVISTKRKH